VRIIGWSPDSSLLAVTELITEVTESRVLLLTPSGSVRAELPAVRFAGAFVPNDLLWSPDSRGLLLQQEDSLPVTDLDGQVIARGEVADIRDLAPDSIGGDGPVASFGWSDTSTLTVTVAVPGQGNDPEALQLNGHMSGGRIEWEIGGSGDLDRWMAGAAGSFTGPYPQWVTESGEFAGSRAWGGAWHEPGVQSALITHNDAGTPPGAVMPDSELALFVAHGGQYTTIGLDLPQDYFFRRAGTVLGGPQATWDAVVVE
jgi:hypothetical protein